jgi:hypothetical protein
MSQPSVRIASFDGTEVKVSETDIKSMASISDFFDVFYREFRRIGMDPKELSKRTEIALHFPPHLSHGDASRQVRKGAVAAANQGSRIDRLSLASAGLLAAGSTTLVRDEDGNITGEIKPSRREVIRRIGKGLALMGAVGILGAALPESAAAACGAANCSNPQCGVYVCQRNRPGEEYLCRANYQCLGRRSNGSIYCYGNYCGVSNCSYKPAGC